MRIKHDNPHTTVLLLLILSISPLLCTAQTVNCTGYHACNHTVVDCNTTHPIKCSVHCNGEEACEYLTVNGGLGVVDVYCDKKDCCSRTTVYGGEGGTNVTCDGVFFPHWVQSCPHMIIYGEGNVVANMYTWASPSLIVCDQDDETALCTYNAFGTHAGGASVVGGAGDLIVNRKDFANTIIKCPPHRYCNITCTGKESCTGSGGGINATIGSKLFIHATGIDTLKQAIIHCPPDALGGADYLDGGVCNIHIHNPGNQLGHALIYAAEGLHNLQVICDIPPCFDTNWNPQMFCNIDNCELTSNGTGLAYADPNCACRTFLLPSPQPTTSPTFLPSTYSPTFGPTLYDPEEEPRTLYLSQNGCDQGFCESPDFDWRSFCDATPTPTPNPLECNSNNTLLLNQTGTVTHSIKTNVYDENNTTKEGVAVLCFDIEASFVCHNPTFVDARFLSTYYFQDPDTRYLNIGYENRTNLLNPNPCWGGIHGICAWLDCTLDTQPYQFDPQWTATDAPYEIYLINGPLVYSWCYGETISMHVELDVSCDALPSTCQSFNYTWLCLNGYLGCDAAGYDGHGKIKMDIGTYSHSDAFDVRDQQIRIQGSGSQTVFEHDSDDDRLISCYFRQCYLTLSQLTYVPIATTDAIVSATDYGNLYFESVYFMNGVQFVLSSNGTAEFTDCVFAQAKFEWNITNNAHVSFTRCSFTNLTADGGVLFVVQNADLSISNSTFNDNHNLFSIIRSADDATVSVTDSTFTNNTNNIYIWDAYLSEATLVNSPIQNGNNDCGVNHCLSFIDSDLTIDSSSASQDTVIFGHNVTSVDVFNTLFAIDFNPQTVLSNITLWHFGADNGSIIFSPCAPFDSELIPQPTYLDEIASTLNVTATHLYTEKASFYDQVLVCEAGSSCFVQCKYNILTCMASHFIANATSTVLFECGSSSSCHEVTIDISDAQISAVLCHDSSACKDAVINTYNTGNFTLECGETDSCNGLMLNLINTPNVRVECYGINACFGLRVSSDSNRVVLSLNSFSQDVLVSVPDDFIQHQLLCNDAHSYLSVDYATYSGNVTELSVDLFGGNMPCEGVTFAFDATDRVDCVIRYEFTDPPNATQTQLSDFFSMEMECYSDIYIADVSSYDCFGTSNPTMDPTIDPTMIPTKQPTYDPTDDPTIDPTDDPTIDPTIDPTTDPTDDPTMDPTMDPTIDPTIDPTTDPTMDPTTDPTIEPTVDPTTDPTTDPTMDPTVDPTLDPTIDPTLDPTMDPTIDPTLDPTIDPTMDPTIDPTTDPTDDPTMDPTMDPTIDPTTDPTIEPTVDPTIDPTTDPTIDPTFGPTIDPTADPSTDPTRQPTASEAYNSIFVIRYLILNLKKKHIDMLLTDAQMVSDDITDIIEKSYSEKTHLILRFFWLEIVQILGFKVKDIDMTKQPHFLKSQKELSLNCTIKCNTDSCDLLLDPHIQPSFQLQAQSRLRDYFGQIEDVDVNADAADASEILFQIDGDTDAIHVQPLYVSEASIWDNYVLVASFITIIVCLLISLCAFAHTKQVFCFFKKTAMDSARWLVFIIYGLQMIDFASDFNLAYEMWTHDRFGIDDSITICAYLSLVFVVLPYSVNLFFAIRIKHRIPKENKMAISYFNSRVLFFVFLMVFCGGVYPALSMVSSGVFGLKQVNSGLTSHELKTMNKIKLIGTIWLENIPQLMIQVVYANASGEISANTAFSFLASVLSILVAVTSYLIEKTDENIATFAYYVEVKKAQDDMKENVPSQLSDEEKRKLGLNKGKTEGLSKQISGAFGCNYKDIEVSMNSEITDTALVLYIIHHTLSISGEKLRTIEKTYDEKSESMSRKFTHYFDLNSKFRVEFKRTMGNVSANEDKEDFTDAVKRLMDKEGKDFESARTRQQFYMEIDKTWIQTMMDRTQTIEMGTIDLARTQTAGGESTAYEAIQSDEEKAGHQLEDDADELNRIQSDVVEVKPVGVSDGADPDI